MNIHFGGGGRPACFFAQIRCFRIRHSRQNDRHRLCFAKAFSGVFQGEAKAPIRTHPGGGFFTKSLKPVQRIRPSKSAENTLFCAYPVGEPVGEDGTPIRSHPDITSTSSRGAFFFGASCALSRPFLTVFGRFWHPGSALK